MNSHFGIPHLGVVRATKIGSVGRVLNVCLSKNPEQEWRASMDVLQRNNVTVAGQYDKPPMLLLHGFGCDQNMWRFVVPHFADDYRIVLMDHVGHGGSDYQSYRADDYSSLDGYARDVLEVCAAFDLTDVVLVGHSVSAMIGALAAIQAPDVISRLVMVGPSPRYLDDEDYEGGFDRLAIDDMLESLESNYLGWSSVMAPVIMGNSDRPELGQELTASFCRTDPAIARDFARVTFLGDNRADLPKVGVPTLVLQCSDDVIAPTVVGRYVADHLPHATFTALRASGHCPNLSAPQETVDAIKAFLDSVGADA